MAVVAALSSKAKELKRDRKNLIFKGFIGIFI